MATEIGATHGICSPDLAGHGAATKHYVITGEQTAPAGPPPGVELESAQKAAADAEKQRTK